MKNTIIISVIVISLIIVAVTVYITKRGSITDYSRQQKTLETGTPAKAKIISLRDNGARLNSNPDIDFNLEITLADGTKWTAMTSATISTVDLSRFQVGSIIDIKYDESDHSNVAIVGGL